MSLALSRWITSGAVDDCYISTMLRLVLGLLKGAVVGGALGFAALKLGVGGGAAAFVTYASSAAWSASLCGKPPWRQDTFWTSALKGIGGLVVGLCCTGAAASCSGGMHLSLPASLGAPPDRSIAELPIMLGPLVGALWGAFVEVDDGGGSGAAAEKNKAKPEA